MKTVIRTSFERIHRSNLIGMGVLPLNFIGGGSVDSLRLDGTETYDIVALGDGPAKQVTVTATVADGKSETVSGQESTGYTQGGGIRSPRQYFELRATPVSYK